MRLAPVSVGGEIILLKRRLVIKSLVGKNTEQAGQLFQIGATTTEYHGQTQLSLVFLY